MFDLGGGELLLIGIVALVVVGPKELPGLFRTVGQFTGKARSMAREFTSAMNAAADQTGVSELNKTLKGVTKPMSYAADRLRETTGLATSSLNSIKPGGATERLAEKLSADRAETKAKIAEAAAKAAEARKAAADATQTQDTVKAAPDLMATLPSAAKADPKPRKPKAASLPPAEVLTPVKPRKSRAKPTVGTTE